MHCTSCFLCCARPSQPLCIVPSNCEPRQALLPEAALSHRNRCTFLARSTYFCQGCQLHRGAYCRAQHSWRGTHCKGFSKSAFTPGTCCFSGYLRGWMRKPKLPGTVFLIYSSRIYLLTFQSGALGSCPSRQLLNPTVVSHQCKSFANVMFLKTR